MPDNTFPRCTRTRAAITGATASGKTRLAIELARAVGGEVVSCDSMCVYKYLQIGTAKPTAEETAGVPHHLIDAVDPRESFSCGDYAILARAALADIDARGKPAIFCGGTGLYLEAALMGTDREASGGARDDNYRAELQKIDTDTLCKMLAAVDPEAAAAIDLHNRVRIIRALEINHAAGMTKGEWDRISRTEMPDNVAVICLSPPRDVLYKRIDRRVDEMLAAGLPDEVRRLYEGGFLPEGSGGARAIGYKELLPYIRGETTLDEAAAALKTATRRYAKRQLTWFRAKPYAVFFEDAHAALEYAVNFLTK